MPTKIDRTGESIIARNGLKMTIINYISTRHMDIQFEDGTIVKDIQYSSFKSRAVKHPNINADTAKDREQRLGETIKNNNGLNMTIIAYRHAQDIDVQFEDGYIVTNKRYSNFKKGIIGHPKKITKTTQQRQNRIGETNTNKVGLTMTIIAYHSFANIDVQFEDGTIVTHKTYRDFKNGQIAHPTKQYDYHLNETNTTVYGAQMKIIAYRTFDDIDVQFEDGFVKQTSYKNFLNGKVYQPYATKQAKTHQKHVKQRLGQTGLANNGMKIKIIAYRGSDDIDVQFEDGTIVTHKTYSRFQLGEIGHPNYLPTQPKTSRIGQTNTNKDGHTMTIIEYKYSRDITVKFDNGYIAYHQSYYNFQTGNIRHTNNIIQRTGETTTHQNGLKMTILEYRDCNDIDIEFEDGTVVYHATYESFKKGVVKYPLRFQMDHAGETVIAKNGLKMTILKCLTAQNITVQFEDNTQVIVKTYRQFKTGTVKHPSLNVRHSVKGSLYGIHVSGIAFQMPEQTYYYATCPICGASEVWTPDDMKEHMMTQHPAQYISHAELIDTKAKQVSNLVQPTRATLTN